VSKENNPMAIQLSTAPLHLATFETNLSTIHMIDHAFPEDSLIRRNLVLRAPESSAGNTTVN
jgi:hypothetical protein